MLAVTQRLVDDRHAIDGRGIAREWQSVEELARLCHAVRTEEIYRSRTPFGAGPIHHELGPGYRAARHPHRNVVPSLQPAGTTHVVRVIVREQDPAQRALREQRRFELLPDLGAGARGHAGVDQREAVAVLEQPEVDVIEVDRQRHAQPVQAGKDFECGTRRVRLLHQIVQARLVGRIVFTLGRQRVGEWGARALRVVLHDACYCDRKGGEG